MEPASSEESVRSTRSRKRSHEQSQQQLDITGQDNENQIRSPSPPPEPGCLVRAHSSPDIQLIDILRQRENRENSQTTEQRNQGGRPSKASKWGFQRNKDRKGQFEAVNPLNLRGRPKKHEFQRSGARDDLGRFIPTLPPDFDNEELIENDSDQEWEEIEFSSELGGIAHAWQESCPPTSEHVDSSDEEFQPHWRHMAEVNEAIRTLDLSAPNSAQQDSEQCYQTASQRKIGTVDSNGLHRRRPLPISSADLNSTIWDNEILQDALSRYQCNCPNKTPQLNKCYIGPPSQSDANKSLINESMIIQCQVCEEAPVMVVDNPGGSTLKKRIVLASIMNGMDYKQLNSFLLTLGLGSFPRTAFFNMRAEMMKPIVEAGQEVAHQNQTEARSVALLRGYQPDDDGCVHLAAAFDGRSSGGMEVAGVKEIFQRTTSYGVKLTYIVADGDSKAYHAVKDEYHGKPVVNKGECELHWAKRIPVAVDRAIEKYLTACRTTAGTTTITRNTPPVGGGPPPWGLKKALDKGGKWVKHLKASVRAAIAQKGISQSNDYNSEAVAKAAEEIAEQILISGRHCCSVHTDCGDWCTYNKVQQGLEKTHREYMPESYLKIIEPMLQDLTQPEMMKRLVFCLTTNDVESLNNLIWSIVHKAKFHGPRLLWMGVSIGFLRMSDGEGGQWRLFQNAGVPLPTALVKYWDTLDKQRVLDSRRAASKMSHRRKVLLADLAAQKEETPQ